MYKFRMGGVPQRLLAIVLVIALVTPSISVKAASNYVTFYVEAPFCAMSSYVGYDYDKGSSFAEWSGLDHTLMCAFYTTPGENKGGYSRAIGKEMVKSGKYYTAYFDKGDTSSIEAALSYLKNTSRPSKFTAPYAYYDLGRTCTAFDVTRVGDDYYAEQVERHTYKVTADATAEHGTEYTCSVCGNKYYDKLKVRLSFNATANGGTTSESSQECTADSTVPLAGKTASKDGWEFVGWNIDKNAKEAMTSVTMNSNRTVYAIFKKDVTVNFIDE